MTIVVGRPTDRTGVSALGMPASWSRLWRRRPRPDLVLALSSSLVCTLVVVAGLDRYPAIGGDEGIYTNQAYAVLHGQITPYTYTYDHPFFGWAQIALPAWLSQVLHLGGRMSVIDDRVVISGYAFATLLLTYGIARRLDMRRTVAVAAVLLLGLSPLFVVNARQVFLDNIALPWVLGSLYIALNPSRRQWVYGVSGVCLAVGILTKETVVLFLPAVFYVVWTKAYRPIRILSVATFATLGSLVVAIYPLFAVLRNELLPGPTHVSLWTNGIMYQLETRAGSGALWQHGSERQDLLDGWLYYDHWLIYGGAVCSIATLVSRRLRVLGVAYILCALPVLKPAGYLPSMYVIASLPFAALCMAAVFDAAHNLLLKTGVQRAVVAGVVGTVALAASIEIGHSYVAGDRNFTTAVATSRDVGHQKAALRYILTHAGRRDNILTDDGLWADLVRAGHGSVRDPWAGAVSYYQFDLDPKSSTAYLPQGWQDINWIMLTQAMRDNVDYLGLAKLKETISHSKTVATFGAVGSDSEISILEVAPTLYNHHGP